MCRLKLDSRYVPVLLAAAAQLKLTILTIKLYNTMWHMWHASVHS